MSSPALRQAWAEWCSFADALDLSDGSADCAALHARLFRLCGSHQLRARDLRAARDGLREAFGPWLGEEGNENELDGELVRLRQALDFCELGWRVLLRTLPGRQTNWDEVERVALSAGLARPEEPFWSSPLYVPGQRFDLLLALRGRDHAESLALLDALLRILNHPRGGPLFEWARTTPVLTRPAEALRTAALFRASAEQDALRDAWLGPLGWGPLPERLRRLCEDISLCLLARLNEPLPTSARPAAGRTGAAVSGETVRQRPPSYRRAVPEPLPVEPWLQKVRGSEPFLRAIAEEPLEDAHRLAFADWLEDAGHPERGALIRLQCRHDQLPDHPLARRALAVQIASLLKEHAATWMAGLPTIEGLAWKEAAEFRRGLLEHLEVGWHLDAQAGARLFGLLDLRSLRTRLRLWELRDFGPGGLRDFLGMAWVPRLVSLEIEPMWHVTDLPALGTAPGLAGLLHLALPGGNLNTALVCDLAEALRLPALASLDLSGNHIGDDGARVLAANPALGSLRKLQLRGDINLWRASEVIGLPGIRALASSAALANLEHLDVSWNRFPSSGVEALAASPFLANVTTLVLEHCSVGNKGAKALASSPFLTKLTCLDLRHAGLREEGAKALARSANLAHLTVLDLGGNKGLGEEGLRALADSPHLAGLRALSLRGVPLTLEGVRALAEAPWANLETCRSLKIKGLSESG